MLAASQKPTHGKKPCRPIEFLCSAVLPPIQSAIALAGTEPGPRALVTPASIAEHVDCLSMCRHISTPLETSVRTIASTLIASLELSLAGWNLSMLARFIFEEAPRASSAVHCVTAEAWKVLPPVVFFPAYSGLALEERQTRIDYDTLHKACSQMDVSRIFQHLLAACINMSILSSRRTWRGWVHASMISCVTDTDSAYSTSSLQPNTGKQ